MVGWDSIETVVSRTVGSTEAMGLLELELDR